VSSEKSGSFIKDFDSLRRQQLRNILCNPILD
jgi:hypothetical protein